MDFVILKVNGEDVSNATHEEAVAAFCKAKEPIFIEVLRRSGGGTIGADASAMAAAGAESDERRQLQQQQSERFVSVSTQTDWDTDGAETFWAYDEHGRDDEVVICNDAATAMAAVAAGQGMLDSCVLYLPPPPPLELMPAPPPSAAANSGSRGWNQRCSRRGLALSAGSELCLTDLENAYEGEGRQQHQTRDADRLASRPSAERLQQQPLNGSGCSAAAGPAGDDFYPAPDGSYDEMYTYEEVVLQRECPSDRVGLTLCYALGDDGSTCVLVGEVEAGGAAAADGRIHEGDRILEINGEAVDSREAVIRLFSVNQKDIRLLLCRQIRLQWDDDGFAEEPSQDLEDVIGCPRPGLAASTPMVDEEEEEVVQPSSGHHHHHQQQQQQQQQQKFKDFSGPPERAATKASDDGGGGGGGAVAVAPETGARGPAARLRSSADSGCGGAAAVCQQQQPQPLSHHICDAVDSGAGPAAYHVSSGSSSSSSGSSGCRAKPRMGTRLVQPSGPGAAMPRAASVGREDCSPIAASSLPAAAGRTISASSPSSSSSSSSAAAAADCVQSAALQAEESSGHDTAYNTAESCRSASLSLKPQQLAEGCGGGGAGAAAGSSQAWLSRGGSMLSLVLPSATDEASQPCQAKNGASCRDGGSRQQQVQLPPVASASSTAAPSRACSSSSSRDKQARGSPCSSSSGGGHVGRKSAAGRCTADADGAAQPQLRGSCDIMYTNKENLATTMALQQRLLEQRLAAVLPGGSASAGGDGRAEAEDAAAAGRRGAADASAVAYEWVLKRRPDGSRYVVRRPVAQARGTGISSGGGAGGGAGCEAASRPTGASAAARNRLLEERQRRLERERASMTTDDDDAASELKMGRYWSRADRRRHLVSARDGRRRKEERLRGGRPTAVAMDYSGGGGAGEGGALRRLREEDEGACGGGDAAAEAAAATHHFALAQATLGQQHRLAPQPPPRRAMDMMTVQDLLLRASRTPELLTVTTV